ncbi:ubiquitin-related modifier 1 isoform X2 [Triplophysa dalaica]|uniref:ubiquitin-related modifier 1 isoform X2 n=1 Tax=Triplophysa dalaica TaxID=1582913 RepID=UPI0024DFC407|nr:ubiquitin-related modifier 1 isoform X2 [Triplophysa dalaica]
MAAPLALHLEFGGGAELLFDGVKNHHVTLPGQSDPCVGLCVRRAGRYNDRYTTEEADSDPINLKQPLLLDPCLSVRITAHAHTLPRIGADNSKSFSCGGNLPSGRIV